MKRPVKAATKHVSNWPNTKIASARDASPDVLEVPRLRASVGVWRRAVRHCGHERATVHSQADSPAEPLIALLASCMEDASGGLGAAAVSRDPSGNQLPVGASLDERLLLPALFQAALDGLDEADRQANRTIQLSCLQRTAPLHNKPRITAVTGPNAQRSFAPPPMNRLFFSTQFHRRPSDSQDCSKPLLVSDRSKAPTSAPYHHAISQPMSRKAIS